MDFFESQDQAKRNTGRLILLFALAVLSLIVITNLFIMLVFGFFSTEMTSMAATQSPRLSLDVFLIVSVVVVSVVLLGSLYRISQLSGGGARIAEMMNGRLLLPGSKDLHEQRVMNVVEEMALASGTPVPPVYLMEETGINAFAAGYSPSDAVIGVTRGAIETLSRDQLQGVIAHEFSHILHGDMRINIRLIGVLYGILVLGIIGEHLLRSGSRSRRSKDSGGVMALGLGLLVIGYVGTFFGNMIKAAVSRQREYLADASAVQFTRNPDGIAGALMQIATHSSYLDNPNGKEISHALFEEAGKTAFRSLYATHPPLEDRITAILPRWDGSYDLIKEPAAAEEEQQAETAAGEPSAADKFSAILAGTAGAVVADSLINHIGNPDPHHLSYAKGVLAQLPEVLLDAAHEPSGARAVIYFLILQKDEPVRGRQLEFLAECADEGVFAELESLIAQATAPGAELRLPLVSIALASLRQLSARQYALFKENFQQVIGLDKTIKLHRWALQKIVFHHLDEVFEKRRPRRQHLDIKRTDEACQVLLSILAHSNPQQDIDAEQAFQAGAEKLGKTLELLPAKEISFGRLNNSIDELARLKPLQKPRLLKACAACITADGKIRPIEVELLRAVAATIDCPMPPLPLSY